MGITRRDLVKNGVAIAALGLVAPRFLAKTAYGIGLPGIIHDSSPGSPQAAAGNANLKKNILLVIQLSGGNDGLGTVIPYPDRTYFAARPTLAPKPDEILKITDTVGLHPSLKGLQGLYNYGHVAIMQGVGYPNPNRSHFRSMQIWQTARPDVNEPTGWLGRYLEANDDDEANTLRAMNVGALLPRTLYTESTLVPSITNLETYQFRTDTKYANDTSAQIDAIHHLCDHSQHGAFEEYIRAAAIDAFSSSEMLKKAVGKYQSSVQYGNNAFAEGLKMVAQVIAADLGTRIFYVSLGGFDTHSNQARTHGDLLQMLDEGITTFYNDLERMGKADQVAIMTFSEFGRRVAENGSMGTDHGTALPLFVLGGNIKGGVYGNNPDLTNLDQGDLRMQTDFRSVYASVIKNWLGADPTKVLEGNWSDINFTLARTG